MKFKPIFAGIGLMVLCLFKCKDLNAQPNKKCTLEKQQKELGFSLSIPAGYTECDSAFDHRCGDFKIPPYIYYAVKNKKDSCVKIGLYSVLAEDSMSFEKMKYWHFISDTLDWRTNRNTNYLRVAQNFTDTTFFKMRYYDNSYIKQVFNADHVIMTARHCTMPCETYKYNRLVIVSKDDKGFVMLTYLYNDDYKYLIDDEIKRTEGMIHFNN